MSCRPSPFLVVVTLMIATAARAELYTWTDDDGVTHYTDTPRQNGAHEERTRPQLTNSPMALPEPGTWEVQRDNDDEGRTPSRAEREAAAREKRCQRYETRLARVNEELASGYQEPRGNQLRAERRELRSKIFSEC